MDRLHCYDFPLVVMHRAACPRYQGGTCYPITLVPPYAGLDEDAADAVTAYLEITADAPDDPDALFDHLMAQGGKRKRVPPTGRTVASTGEEIL